MSDEFKASMERQSIYRVRARNTAAESENKIHDDAVAAEFGFRGGLVPGVTVYAYMTAPLVERFPGWLEHGAMRVKFQQPFYEGEEVVVLSEAQHDDDGQTTVVLRAERDDGTICATGVATVEGGGFDFVEPLIEDFPQHPLPLAGARPYATRENVKVGSPLGSLEVKIDISLLEQTYLRAIDERLPVYFGERAVAHPGYLLSLANEIFVRNFVLGPWIHAGSELKNWSVVRDGDRLSVRGRIADGFERKGHEFVTLDLLLLADHTRLVQQVRHTAIYKVKKKSSS